MRTPVRAVDAGSGRVLASPDMKPVPQSIGEVRSRKAAVLARDGYRCVYCGLTNDQHKATLGFQLGVRRLVPGSAYTVAGCETLCRSCAARRPLTARKRKGKNKRRRK